MGQPKMTGFIISLLIISLIAFTFTSFIGGVTDRYSTVSNITYDNATLAKYQKLNNLTQEVKNIKDEANKNVDPNPFDVIGGYLKSGYSAIKVSFVSFDVFNTMAQESIIDSDLVEDETFQGFQNNLRMVLVSIVIVLIFVGILISILVKKDII